MLHDMFLEKEFIGQKLKEYRKKLNISQEKLAEKVGIALKHYGRLERGTCIPTLITFFKLVDILNIPLSEFGTKNIDIIDKNRNELIKEIYLSSTEQVVAFLNIIRTIKSLK